MSEKAISILILSSIIIFGVITIIFPKAMIKTESSFGRGKKPSQETIKRYIVSGYVMTLIGIALIVLLLLDIIHFKIK